jgi:multidrug transporter EmrE-like cation transporter
MSEPWFNPNVYSFIPGVAIGLVGATLGVLTGVLAPRGKARGIVVGLYLVAIVASIALLGVAVVALATGQPYGIWYGFGLPGLIGSIVFTLLYGVVQQRYREADVRRMGAADLQ